jgi:ADP-heptose:LPS heptosyltransferase
VGLGDWLMATADIRRAHAKWGVRCLVGDGKRSFWSEVFEGNPKVCKAVDLKPGEKYAWVPNFPQHRPYIAEIVENHFIYKPDFKVEPGELFTKRREKGDYIVIEPNVKQDMTGPNKDWGFVNWVALSRRLKGDLVQLGPKGTRKLKRARCIQTDTFTEALEWLSGARLLITTDGALHHAAAALGVPAVVLWGGVASPKNLGYDSHTNIWHGDEPCGTFWMECPHCKSAMSKIKVDDVHKECERYLAS